MAPAFLLRAPAGATRKIVRGFAPPLKGRPQRFTLGRRILLPMSGKKKKSPGGSTIALNRRAKFDYHLEERFEAGIALEGWEVKSLREGRGQLVESYVLLQNGEAWLLGARINPSTSTCTHEIARPDRQRKLLLHRKELARIHGAVSAKGYTCVATSLYWKGPLAKAEIALAKGKREFDKRQDKKDHDWQREKARIMKAHNG